MLARNRGDRRGLVLQTGLERADADSVHLRLSAGGWCGRTDLNLHGRDPPPPGGGAGTGSRLLHYFSMNRVDSRGLQWTPVDSTGANKRLAFERVRPQTTRRQSVTETRANGFDSLRLHHCHCMRSVSAVPVSLADARSSFGDNGWAQYPAEDANEPVQLLEVKVCL